MFLCKYFLYIITGFRICFTPICVHETMLFENVSDSIFWISFSKWQIGIFHLNQVQKY